MYLGKENRYLHAIHHNSVVIQSLAIHGPTVIAEMPPILDSFFNCLANTTSTYIRVEGKGSGEPLCGGQIKSCC